MTYWWLIPAAEFTGALPVWVMIMRHYRRGAR